MTIVSSKEFINNQKRYFDLALNQQIVIKRGKNLFQLVYKPVLNDDDEDAELLTLAKSRMNDEFTSGEEYQNFLNKLINEHIIV
jgi:hypothetical protein